MSQKQLESDQQPRLIVPSVKRCTLVIVNNYVQVLKVCSIKGSMWMTKMADN